MWTTEIIDINKRNALLDAVVAFKKDGVLIENFLFKNVSNPDTLKTLIYNQLQQYKKVDSIVVEETLGEVDLTSVTPIVKEPHVPTQAEIDEQTYSDKVGNLVQAKKAIELGVIPANDPKYLALLKYCTDNFKIAYLKYF